MRRNVAIVGAGVSGLTCGVVLAENGFRASILAAETGQQTTSAAAAAIWYPYDAEPFDLVISRAVRTYEKLAALSEEAETGVSMIELHLFARETAIQIPSWAVPLGARTLPADKFPNNFVSGFSLNVPLTDTTSYLDYLADRFTKASGAIVGNTRFEKLEELSTEFDLVVNCAGFGAKKLVNDSELEPHRGQVVIVPRIDLAGALVCDDAPLMYVILRANDCVFGGTNELNEKCEIDSDANERIVAECCRVLNIDRPRILAERVGLRPFRKSGVRLCAETLGDGRSVIHNYGHGGSGFTLSWGCAEEVLQLARKF